MMETLASSGVARIVEPESYPIDKFAAVHDEEYINFIKNVNYTPIQDAEFAVRYTHWLKYSVSV